MQTSEMPRRHRPPVPYWLIVRREVGEVEPLTLDVDGETTTLPVFSFEEEAAMYLRLTKPGRGWWIREITSGELVSMLFGPRTSVRLVALDPPPEQLSSRGAIRLVSMSVKRFVDHLVKAQPAAI